MDETFKVFDRVLSFAGIPIFEKRNWNSKRWLFFQIFNFIVGLLTIIFTTCFVISKYPDLLLCIQGACIWVTGVIMFISLGVCLVFRKDFQEFLTEMGFRDGVLEMPFIVFVLGLKLKYGKLGELKELVVDSQEELLKFARVLLKTYVASVWLSATLYLCGPIYRMCTREDESLRLLAFDMWFPWSLENFNVYVASFTFHAYAGYLCCIAYPGLQSTIILLVGQTIRNLRILSFILLHLDELTYELHGSRNNEWQPCCTNILSQCVVHYVKIKRLAKHFTCTRLQSKTELPMLYTVLTNSGEAVATAREEGVETSHLLTKLTIVPQDTTFISRNTTTLNNFTLRFSNRLNIICQPFYLVLILAAIILVCMCSVKIAISSKLSLDIMKYYVHEICFILVVLMFCLVGQQVENECEKLEAAVTEKWYVYDKIHRVNVRIFKMALTQRMPIYIFGSVPLSLPTFTWFLKTGMSFFTVVMSVVED